MRASFEAFIQDESARELLALSADAGAAWRPLVTCVTFFRSGTRALAWDRGAIERWPAPKHVLDHLPPRPAPGRAGRV